MGVETASFISGLTPSWPLAGDTKSQGDDHIRLLKATLQATFPTANKAWYFPKTEAVSSTIVLDATDQNNLLTVDTSGGNVAVTLPALAAGDVGWECEVVKTSNDVNAALVAAASGNIATTVGSVATVRVGVVCSPCRFKWTGTAWLALKQGPNIGSVESFDGATTPPGYLDTAGGTYSNTSFAELFAVLASTTLRDRRGRMDIGEGTGTGLTARVAGTTYGGETHTLTAAQLPAITSANAAQGITLMSGTHFPTTATSWVNTGINISPATVNGPSTATVGDTNGISGTVSISVTSQGTNGNAHPILSPAIGAKRIIRAC